MNTLMEPSPKTAAPERWTLPPLILHPFTGDQTTEQLLAGSKAMLTLNGMLPGGPDVSGELSLIVQRGRVQEIRMLYFLGKDVVRWMEQCTDFVSREPALQKSGFRPQSFAALLVENPPASVSRKMTSWGVTDHKSVFSRAIGITSCFGEPPTIDSLACTFIDHYHRFADYLFMCYQMLSPFLPVPPAKFDFELYASAEYSDMLSQQFLNDMS